MSPTEIAGALIRIVREFHERGNVLFTTLIRRSGYCSMPDKVTERLILDALAEHPEFIEDWQIWSEDKRTDGWYWLKNEDGNYSVKRSINGVGIVESLSFSDAAHACAAFIKRDVEASRLRAIRSSN